MRQAAVIAVAFFLVWSHMASAQQCDMGGYTGLLDNGSTTPFPPAMNLLPLGDPVDVDVEVVNYGWASIEVVIGRQNPAEGESYFLKTGEALSDSVHADTSEFSDVITVDIHIQAGEATTPTNFVASNMKACASTPRGDYVAAPGMSIPWSAISWFWLW